MIFLQLANLVVVLLAICVIWSDYRYLKRVLAKSDPNCLAPCENPEVLAFWRQIS